MRLEDWDAAGRVRNAAVPSVDEALDALAAMEAG